MHRTLTEYTSRLRRLQTRQDLVDLYEWFWDQAPHLPVVVDDLNSSLRLEGDNRFTYDLPTLAIGGFRGLVVLAVNPGYRREQNALEDGFCRLSKANYVQLKLGFFKTHPEVVGRHIPWWAHALSYAPLIDEWRDTYGEAQGLARWNAAHESQLVGGWELVPFHSESDGITKALSADLWFRTWALESIQALARIRPRSILVASKAGASLVRGVLYPRLEWRESRLGSRRFGATLSRGVTQDDIEIFILSRQLSAPRDFTVADVLAEARQLRTASSGRSG